MIPVDEIPAEPPAELRFRRRISFVESIRGVWRSRELIRTLAERDLRARYKQAVLGFAWAIIPPVGLLVVFTVFVQRVGEVFTEGAPYQLFAYVGLVPWAFSSGAIATGGNSLVNSMSLLNKVNCPREVFPLAQIGVAAADAAAAAVLLLPLMAYYGRWPGWTALWVPVLVLVQVTWTVGVVAILAAVVVYLRDVRHGLPILLQLALFATPIAYSLSSVPAEYRGVYAFVNPLAPVIDGYRRTLLRGLPPDPELLGIGATSAVLLLCGGYYLFKRLETGIADVA